MRGTHRTPSAETELLIAEANHRIANHLALIAGSVRLHAEQIGHGSRPMEADEVSLLLREVAERITVIGDLHRLLTAAARPSVEVGQYLREVCAAQIASLARPGQVELAVTVAPRPLRCDQMIPIALIVSELLTNAVKHAGADGSAGRIALGCRDGARGALIVEVADDGGGLPKGFNPARDGGVGLRIVHALSRQIGATIAFESSDGGLCVRLTVPAASAR